MSAALWAGSILAAVVLGFWLGVRFTRALANKAGSIAEQTLPIVESTARDLQRAMYFWEMCQRLVEAGSDEEAAEVRAEMERFRAGGEQLG